MSTFSNNLPILRRRAGYTQEALAEAAGVSRQAVGKWEAGQSMPEAATLLVLAEVLGCTLDQLMREELEEGADSPPPALKRQEEGEDLYRRYAAHMARFALLMALGVALVLTGVAAMLFTYLWVGESGLIVLPLLLCLAAAVFLFVYGGMDHDVFLKRYPRIPDCRDAREEERFQGPFRLGIALATAAIIGAVALLVTGGVLFDGNQSMEVLTVAFFLLILAGAVGALVFLGIFQEKYDLEGYAREADKIARETRLEEKLEDQVDAALEEALEEKEHPWTTPIMLGATVLFLLAGFLLDAWHPAWIIFLAAALLNSLLSRKET